MLASKKNGVIYIGVTSNLVGRIYEHKNKVVKSFTKKYWVQKFVWYEEFEDMTDAIYEEKKMKKWNRDWKIRLIEERNSEWRDLYKDIL